MEKFCIIDSLECPKCKKSLQLIDGKCVECKSLIRRINVKRIQNPQYLKGILEFYLDGKIKANYSSVYEAFPLDSREEHKKRSKVVEVCDGKRYSFNGSLWKYSDDPERINKLQKGKRIIQIDFSGEKIMEFVSVSDAADSLSLSYGTVANACKSHRPPQCADYFLFYEKEFCNDLFSDALNEYTSKHKKIIVYNEKKEYIGEFDSYENAGKQFLVSPTTIKNWCTGEYKPSGNYENFSFVLENVIYKNKESECTCFPSQNFDYKNSLELNTLKLKNIELKDQIKKYKKNEKEFKKEVKQYKRMSNQFIFKKPRIDNSFEFMLPIDKFIKDIQSRKISGGASIYILCDKNGKRYVGQTAKNYSRIVDHFNGNSDDMVYKAHKNGMKFALERIIIGWEDNQPLNLNEAERYYIEYYDSFNNGYNQTKGNA